MTTGQTVTAEQPAQPIEWKLVLATGGILGALGGLLSLFGKEWYNFTVPAGMMIASWITVNRAKGRRLWGGFTASFVAGVLAWAINLAVNYSNLIVSGVTFGRAVQLSAAFLLPLILIIGLFGSWIFTRTRERVLASQQRMQAQKTERKQMIQNRSKKKHKKKR